MKNVLLTVSAAMILLVACNSEKKESLDTDKQIVFSDTSAARGGDVTTDVAPAGTTVPAAVPAPQPAPPVQTITKVVHVYEKQPKQKAAPVVTNTPPVQTAPTAEVPGAGTVPSTTASTGTDGSTGTVPAPTEAEKKKGWSGAAKGATIGGVGGAAAGAIIGKGAKGAIIGGVVGAAGGYIIGRKADKKSGRVDTTGN